MNDRNNSASEGFGSRSGPLELYKLLVDEVNRAVGKSGADLLAQLQRATESLEKKSDDNFRLLSARIEENRTVARGENERMVSKIDHIVDVLGQGNARFAVIEQRIATVESRCDGESGRRREPVRRQPTADAPSEGRGSKMSPFLVAALGAVAATLGGAITTWALSGGLTTTPHSNGAAVSPSPRSP